MNIDRTNKVAEALTGAHIELAVMEADGEGVLHIFGCKRGGANLEAIRPFHVTVTASGDDMTHIVEEVNTGLQEVKLARDRVERTLQENADAATVQALLDVFSKQVKGKNDSVVREAKALIRRLKGGEGSP